MVGRTRYRLPLNGSLERKFEALEERLALRVLASAPRDAPGGDGTFALQRGTPVAALDGPLFYGALPARIARELRHRPADAILAQSPYEALAALAGGSSRGATRAVVVEIHGDWRTWSRLYGSRARAVVAPLADRAALVAIRRADAVRTLSAVHERDRAATRASSRPASSRPTPSSPPSPSRPWRRSPSGPSRCSSACSSATRTSTRSPTRGGSRPRGCPTRRLRMVGDGRHRDVVEALVDELPGQVTWESRLETADVVKAFDDAWLLLLASRSEGTPRVVLEALCRGRAVVGARAGGIPDVVRDGETGLLVDPAAPPRSPTRSCGSSPTASWRSASAPAAARSRPSGRTRRTSTPTASSSSSAGPWRPGGDEARRRHAAGRPGQPGARGDRRQAAGARGAGRRARRARGQRGRGRAARELQRQAVRRAPPGGPRRCASRRRSRGSSRGGPGPRRCSRTCARSTPCSPRRSRGRSASTSCSGSRTGGAAGCCRAAERVSTKVLSVDERTFPLRLAKLVAIGHGIDVSDFPCVERPEREPLTLLALGRTSPAKGLETILRAVAAGAGGATPRRRPVRHGGGAHAPDRARAARHRARPARPRRHQRPGAAACRSVALRRRRRARQRHARGRRRQGRLRGGRDVPAGDRLEPRLRHAPARAAAVRARRTPRASRTRSASCSRPTGKRSVADAARHRHARALGRASGPTASSSSLGERPRPSRREGRGDLRVPRTTSCCSSPPCARAATTSAS